MHTRKVFLAVMLAVATVAASGCRTAPVHNVNGAPIVPTGSTDVTMEQVKNAIIRAGAGLGWQMKPIERGHILGVLYLRSHVAKVDIRYDSETYSITYKDSTNLEYQDGKIHSNYNGWIQNLDTAIRNQITMI